MTALCLICGNPLPAIAIQHNDLFCSNTCARTHYENPLPQASIWQRDQHEPRKKVAGS